MLSLPGTAVPSRLMKFIPLGDSQQIQYSCNSNYVILVPAPNEKGRVQKFSKINYSRFKSSLLRNIANGRGNADIKSCMAHYSFQNLLTGLTVIVFLDPSPRLL